MNNLNEVDKAYLRGVCQAFFVALVDRDLHDHPQVFEVLDDEVRAKGYMISAGQKGVFGTVLKFERVS